MDPVIHAQGKVPVGSPHVKTMPKDEQAIRSLVAAWLDATKRGDTRAVLDLMADDALFLAAGQPPMGRSAFEAASNAQAFARMNIDVRMDIQEIHVEGTMAWMWSNMEVVVTPDGARDSITRAGQTLTVLRKVDGRWLLCRDANLLVKK
jgi:uncharacterized protein (TIGR02246 family)